MMALHSMFLMCRITAIVPPVVSNVKQITALLNNQSPTVKDTICILRPIILQLTAYAEIIVTMHANQCIRLCL